MSKDAAIMILRDLSDEGKTEEIVEVRKPKGAEIKEGLQKAKKEREALEEKAHKPQYIIEISKNEYPLLTDRWEFEIKDIKTKKVVADGARPLRWQAVGAAKKIAEKHRRGKYGNMETQI